MHIRIGTMDAMMTAKRDVWVRPLFCNILYESLLISPQQVIDNSTREVDEVLRFDCHHLSCTLKHLARP